MNDKRTAIDMTRELARDLLALMAMCATPFAGAELVTVGPAMAAASTPAAATPGAPTADAAPSAPRSAASAARTQRPRRPPPTAGSLSGPPPPDCTVLREQYARSQACFAPYRLANGGLKPEAFERCTPVVNPAVQCGSEVR